MSIQLAHNTLHLGPQMEQACDSLRQQGGSMHLAVGLTKGDLCPSTTLTESATRAIVDALVIPPDAMWSTLMLYTKPFPPDLLQQARPCHEVLFLVSHIARDAIIGNPCRPMYMMRFKNFNLMS